MPGQLASNFQDEQEIASRPFRLTNIQLQAIQCAKEKTFVCFGGGAGSGKTFLILRLIIIRACAIKSDHLVLRKTLSSAKGSICAQGLPEVLAICFPQIKLGVHIVYNKADNIYTFFNGSRIKIDGTDDKQRLDKLLGPSWSTIYFNETSEMSEEAFEITRTRLRQNSGLKLIFFLDCNPPYRSHWTYQKFILKLAKDRSPLSDADKFVYFQMNPKDNEYLRADYVEMLKNMPTKMRKRFYDGEFTDDAEGALWSQKDIDNNRIPYKNYADLLRDIPMAQIVIGVDPAASTTENSDLTGIVAVAAGQQLDKNNREQLYVLADWSCKAKPLEWATKAINLFHAVGADLIVAEINNGGEMVVETLRSAGFMGKIETVHASRSKRTRAEPIEALYEQGYVHHLDSAELADLEQEMTSYVQHMLVGKDPSPDRMDAMVWAAWYLTTHNNHAKFIRQIDPVEIKKAAHAAGLRRWQ